ncbi:diacylglycerol kinase family protein [Kitasatospora sp. NPDC058201]|uniref:diacylglycerol kinase family protein n=1 Tax=unclassified Kitasatospora TaxID=2633591 RepID=UPI00364A9D9F
MMTPGGIRSVRRIVLALPAQTVVLVLAGLLVTHPPFGLWDQREPTVVTWLAEHRNPSLDRASGWVSAIGFTPAIVAATAAVMLALVLAGRPRRWREALFVGGAVLAQAVVFVTAAAMVGRSRPDVVRLDGALATSSFPSGHVGAATALYGALAVLALRSAKGRRRYLPVVALLCLVPLLVAASRLYRGMHHPTDVVAGLLNGAVALWILSTLLRPERRPAARRAVPSTQAAPGSATAGAAAGSREAAGPAGRRAMVVSNPVVTDPAVLDDVLAVLAAHGYREPRVAETDPDDLGRSAAARAVADGFPLLVVCGGDGTVTACAQALAGTRTALAVVPCGTGNLLARNLGLPTSPARALAAALDGAPRRIDLALAEGDGIEPTLVGAMAGIGLDAAVMADTGRGLKRRLGWAAYLVGIARHLGDRRMRLAVTLDDGATFHRRAAMAVVGNVGSLQGGVRLLPQAEPDDGVLDLVLFQPRGLAGWCTATLRLVTGRHGRQEQDPRRGGTGQADRDAQPTQAERPARGNGSSLEHFRGRRITLVTEHGSPRELDGEPVGDGRRLRLTVRPGALLVHAPVPAGERPGRRRATVPPPRPAAEPTGPSPAGPPTDAGPRTVGAAG